MDDWATTTEQTVLDHALGLAAESGWSAITVRKAGAAAGLSAGETDLLLPDGARDLAALYSRRLDDQALATLPDPSTLKIRERIRAAVVARMDAASAELIASQRLAGFLALPHNLPLAARLTWESAEAFWRWAGDTATDENHYSKRAILSALLASSLTFELFDGREAALRHLDNGIDKVMAFEKWKATTRLKPSALLDYAAEALGRLRHRAGATS
ncbi:MAG: rpsU-divergently transcribed protein [Caulobacteraceae bacterium]|nr:rpsU-divergently transcribed protein [Caulobacteraceae bacterium]